MTDYQLTGGSNPCGESPDLARWCEAIDELTSLGRKYGIDAEPVDPDGEAVASVCLEFKKITSAEHLAEQVRALATTMETHLQARANRARLAESTEHFINALASAGGTA